MKTLPQMHNRFLELLPRIAVSQDVYIDDLAEKIQQELNNPELTGQQELYLRAILARGHNNIDYQQVRAYARMQKQGLYFIG